ncbi:hypothetical protein ACFUN7_28460 [Streptomyces sp. NPDC057236]|uniref:hypothetical protein n=1 Tax=Streptomyces sp. NPDC057236 TaxID=3346059 RepID=UPI00363FEAFE
MPFAVIADRSGRKRILLGCTVFDVVSLMVMLTDTAEVVIAVCVLLGLGGAMVVPTALSLIRLISTDFLMTAALVLLAQRRRIVHGALPLTFEVIAAALFAVTAPQLSRIVGTRAVVATGLASAGSACPSSAWAMAGTSASSAPAPTRWHRVRHDHVQLIEGKGGGADALKRPSMNSAPCFSCRGYVRLRDVPRPAAWPAWEGSRTSTSCACIAWSGPAAHDVIAHRADPPDALLPGRRRAGTSTQF